ncbi:MAG: TRAM domain-containing protein [Bdellovibrionota bacterium]
MLAPQTIIEIEIDRLSYDGGRGVGRHEGMVVFIPFSVPGDLLKCEITQVHSSFCEAKIIEILKPSAHRMVAPCPVFGRCGGCRWQNVKYEEQIRQKEGFIRYALRDVLAESAEIKMVNAPQEYRYRNRIQLHKKRPAVGYYAEGTHDLVAIDDCPIADLHLKTGIDQLKTGYKDGKYELIYAHDELRIKDLSREGIEFSQVNPAQNVNLRHQVMAGLTEDDYKYIYDFYCGSGNFTFQLARAFAKAQIVAVESNDIAIGRAWEMQHALKHEKLATIHFFSDDVAKFIKNIEPTKKTLMVLNPPRAGLQNTVVDKILELKPQNLVYVSCNLATLARDLNKLKSAYEIKRIAGVDMFPQTEYVECIVHLSLS